MYIKKIQGIYFFRMCGGKQAIVLEAGSRFNQAIISGHPEMTQCHSEPFDRLSTGSAKNLSRTGNYGILRRPRHCGTPQNDNSKQCCWMDGTSSWNNQWVEEGKMEISPLPSLSFFSTSHFAEV